MLANMRSNTAEKDSFVSYPVPFGRLRSVLIGLDVELTVISGDLQSEAGDGNLRELIHRVRNIKTELSAIRALLRTTAVTDAFVCSDDALTARQIISDRSKRAEHFPPSLFSDSAWDILLNLALAKSEGVKTTVGTVAETTSVPLTTAIRWIDALVHHQLVKRSNDPNDQRRIYAELTNHGAEVMGQFLAECRRETIDFVRSRWPIC